MKDPFKGLPLQQEVSRQIAETKRMIADVQARHGNDSPLEQAQALLANGTNPNATSNGLTLESLQALYDQQKSKEHYEPKSLFSLNPETGSIDASGFNATA